MWFFFLLAVLHRNIPKGHFPLKLAQSTTPPQNSSISFCCIHRASLIPLRPTLSCCIRNCLSCSSSLTSLWIPFFSQRCLGASFSSCQTTPNSHLYSFVSFVIRMRAEPKRLWGETMGVRGITSGSIFSALPLKIPKIILKKREKTPQSARTISVVQIPLLCQPWHFFPL